MMADITKCKDCKYYQRVADYHADPRGLLYDTDICVSIQKVEKTTQERNGKMKGYKGFNKNLICSGKQYAENTVFEEENAEICKNGMHFCENPFDVLDYYGFIDDYGNINDFAEVEALDEVKKGGKKCCTKKLKIGTKIGVSGLVNAFVDFTLEKTNENVRSVTGDYSATTNTGFRSAATNTGDYSAATNTGDYSAATVEGKESIAVAIGYHSKAKGSLGCWIVVAERNKRGKILTVLAAEVDGKKIKPDTFYTVKNGEFVELRGNDD